MSKSLILALVVGLFCAASADAMTFKCTAEDVDCLIRSISEANLNASSENTIELDPGTYTLAVVNTKTSHGDIGMPVITGALTIIVTAPGTATIQEAKPWSFGMFQLAASANLTLRHVALIGARPAIANYGGTLTVTDSALIGNVDGAINHRGGVVVVARTAFNRNSGTGCAAIDISSGDGQVSDSQFVDNSTAIVSAAICVMAGTLNVTRSSFLRNVSDGAGGIYVAPPGVATVSKSAFSGNSVAGGGREFPIAARPSCGTARSPTTQRSVSSLLNSILRSHRTAP